jgi:DNA-directed RNA polymerase specialized sigma24 family protein
VLDSGLVKLGSQIQPPDRSRKIDLPSPKKEWTLTSESFERLLLWLDADRDRAGEKYEKIRSALIKRFRQLGSCEPDELTNETFDRVARKLPEIVNTYHGDREPYFFSVAYYIHKEHSRRVIIMPLDNDTTVADADAPAPDRIIDETDEELLDSCLKHCMGKLTANKREMILRYYRGQRDVKIKLRRELADSMGIRLTNLRLKAQRIRLELKKCILDCMERSGTDLEFARSLSARGPFTSESGEE